MVWIRTAGAQLPVWRHYSVKEWNLRNYNFYFTTTSILIDDNTEDLHTTDFFGDSLSAPR